MLNKRKREVDDLYREIFGYTETSDTDGNITKIEGLKDELESSYSKLSENLVEALEQVEKLHNEYLAKYSEFESGHKEGYKAVKD